MFYELLYRPAEADTLHEKNVKGESLGPALTQLAIIYDITYL